MKRALPYVILFVFFLTISNAYSKCLLPSPNIELVCTTDYRSNETIKLLPTESHYERLSPNVNYIMGYYYLIGNGQYIGHYINLDEWISLDSSLNIPKESDFDIMAAKCIENITPIKQDLIKLFNEFSSKDHFKRGFSEHTEILPYNSTVFYNFKQQELSSKNILNCYDRKAYRLGEFIVNEQKVRNYCDLGRDDNCFIRKISYPKFISFIVSNPSSETITYLVLFLAIIIMTISFIVYLFKRKELILFFKPTKFSIGIFILIIAFEYWLGLIYLFFESLIFSCILSLIINYVYLRIKKK